MHVITWLLTFIQQIIAQPALLVGIIAMIGLLIQKKSSTDVIKGSVKTVLAIVLIGSGAGVVISGLTPLNDLLIKTFNITGVIPVNEVMFAEAIAKYGSEMAVIMALAMCMNMLLARITKFKFIYLTGHELMWISTLMAIILNIAKLPAWQVIIGGGLLTGLYMTIAPSLIYGSVCKVTGTKEIAVGHTGTVYYWFAIAIAKLTGNKEKSAEDVNVPKSLNFLRDLNVSLTLAMWAVYLVVIILAIIFKPSVMQAVFGTDNSFILGLMYSVTFAAGIYIIQAGVRMMVGELLPAFKGIADKFIPNSIPAVDIPVLYPYQPNSVLIGFLVATIGSIVGFGIELLLMHTSWVLPIMIPTLFNSFFFGATFGALCNKEGGLRGVVFGSFFGGIVTIIIPALLMSVGHIVINNTTFGGGDSGVIGIFFGLLSKVLSGQGLFITIIVLFLLPILFGRSRNRQLVEGAKGAKGAKGA